MPYTHFQYIAYQVPTVARKTTRELIYGINPGSLTKLQLKGDVGGLGYDAATRIRRLIGVMSRRIN